MYKLSDLIGKEAITLSDAKKQGVVFNAHFDETLRQCKYFTLINHDEEIRWVDYKNVLSLENDAVVIRSSEDMEETAAATTVPSPINLKAFNQDGVMMGFVRDVEMENGKAIKFVTDSGEIASLTLLSISDEILVFNDTGKPLKVKPAKKAPSKNVLAIDDKVKTKLQTQTAPDEFRSSNPHDNTSVNTPAPANQPTSANPRSFATAIATSIYKAQNQSAPQGAPQDIQKISQDKTAVYRSPQQQASSKYSFLLGKRLQRNVYDSRGAVIAHENDLISESVIHKAKESGKLVTLALHSL